MPDSEAEGVGAVIKGLGLRGIDQLAFERNLVVIDPDGVVHVADRLAARDRRPMLRSGLEGFGRTRAT